MTNRDKYFKGQHDEENFVCFFRHHGIVLVKEFTYFAIFLFLLSLCLAEVSVIKDVIREDRAMKLLFVTCFLILTGYMHRFFIKMFNYFMNIGIITDVRLIDYERTIFFKDTFDSIDMAQIQNIERQGDGLMANLLGYGDIKIFLNASSAVKTFRYLPNVEFHFRCLNRCMEIRKQKVSPIAYKIGGGPAERGVDVRRPVPFEGVDHTIST